MLPCVNPSAEMVIRLFEEIDCFIMVYMFGLCPQHGHEIKHLVLLKGIELEGVTIYHPILKKRLILRFNCIRGIAKPGNDRKKFYQIQEFIFKHPFYVGKGEED
jgi:hypothetical protein